MASAPPVIFSNARREAVAMRAANLRGGPDAADFIARDIAEDMVDRLTFVRHEPQNALLLGDSRHLAELLRSQIGIDAPTHGDGFDLEQPYPSGGFDFIGCTGILDTVNDLPGALIHLNRALEPGGLAIASFLGAGSLSALRSVMLAADGDRPAPRIHPQVDIQAASGLIQRAGWADPVVDSHTLRVRYSSLERLVGDLRAQGLSNVLATRTPYIGKAGYRRAKDAFAALADDDGKVTESFEIITLTGRRKQPRF